MSLQERKTLPHDVPWWVEEGAAFFITINAKGRGQNVLCKSGIALYLFESVEFRIEQLQWEMLLFLLMPDHLHMIARFNPEPGLQRVVSDWKRYTARQFGIAWQRDFFDHRLRNDNEIEHKAEYIQMNPVRAGLVEDLEDWPYVRMW